MENHVDIFNGRSGKGFTPIHSVVKCPLETSIASNLTDEGVIQDVSGHVLQVLPVHNLGEEEAGREHVL